MRPIKTPLMNDKLLPSREDPDHIDVITLPIYRTYRHVSSCWELSFRERIKVLFSGRVWLDVRAFSHPPVRLRVYE